MSGLLDRIRLAERKCRGCATLLTDHPDIPWCDRCLRRINGAYRPSAVTRMAEDRRMPTRVEYPKAAA